MSGTIYTGDNLPFLRAMANASVDLIYLDPPFNSKRRYAAPPGTRAEGAGFKDKWGLGDTDAAFAQTLARTHPALASLIEATAQLGGAGDQAYALYMAARLMELHRVLRPTGSLYLHCDPTSSHTLKLMLDAIFGADNFRNEIVWSYKSGGAGKKHFARKHDVLLFYAKSAKSYFRLPKEKSYTKAKGRKAGIVQYGQGKSALFQEDERGVFTQVAMRDVWEISYISSTAKERTGYPTQKPLELLRRIIQASSRKGDVVLDPFCGSGAACVAAAGLGRAWIGMDISPQSYELTRARLEKELGITNPKLTHRTAPPSAAAPIDIVGTKVGAALGR